MTKVLVLYYSSYGHIEQMADAVAEGARAGGAEVAMYIVAIDHHAAFGRVDDSADEADQCRLTRAVRPE